MKTPHFKDVSMYTNDVKPYDYDGLEKPSFFMPIVIVTLVLSSCGGLCYLLSCYSENIVGLFR